MDAFATHTDLGVRLKRAFAGDEIAWVTALLEDAADFMRGVIGQQVYPAAESTYTTYAIGGWVELPQTFIRSVTSVTDKTGTALPFEVVQDSVKVKQSDPGPVTIAFTYGMSTVPGDLVNINCALVSQQMLTVGTNIGLSASGLSSVAIDDFKLAFANAGEAAGLAVTPQTEAYLRSRYGRNAWVMEVSR